MARRAGPAGRGQSSAPVDGLEPETLTLVQSFLGTRKHGQTAEPVSTDAWERFHAACLPFIRRLAYRGRSRFSHGDEEDRVQEVWLGLFVNISKYDQQRGPFPGWLASVVRNALTTRDRRAHDFCHLDIDIERQLPSREVDPSTFSEQCETRRIMQSATDELRSRSQETSFQIVHAHWI
jgi:RNA polymerase sigma factor (sigma-70 family)